MLQRWHKLSQRNSDANVHTFDGSGSVLQAEDIAELEFISESLHIDKEKIAYGELSIRKEVITELQTIQVPVTREELVIERRSSDGRCTSEVLWGKTLRIPISKETRDRKERACRF
ncbi:MAG: YsnF/AvaK domain-containing protein [Terriglobales bacterium]